MRVEALDGPAATALLGELDADLGRRYGDDTPVHAAPDEFQPPDGRFVVLYANGLALACGGYRRIDGTTAELKRMYVRPDGRRRGLARLVLQDLETAARAAGYEQLWLETGLSQPEAMLLYEASGYTPVASFGQFAGAPEQRCYGKLLT